MRISARGRQPHPRGTGRKPATGAQPTELFRPEATNRGKSGEAGQ
ncbi:hypothetical protein Actkin_00204 [Actinokineospora sp. UTMC 2448]|nr:hypothetical protein Actkin_00204 [Actinokineospora sp. UTMC 2448]